MIIAGIGFLAVNEFVGRTSVDVPIDGIQCGSSQESYHIHAHLALWHGSRQILVPANIGRSHYGCFYWLHTHRTDGIIHIEAPRTVHSTIGTFFDVWGVPLGRSQVWTLRLKPGEQMRIYVNRVLYRGDSRSIPLRRHTDIAVEIGPPFHIPRPYDFGSL